MIVTGKKHIPFLWIVLATLPWAAVVIKDKMMGAGFTFSMLKFVENPAALTFALSLPFWISLVMTVVVNSLADRIWTRFGRRKPFIIASWIGTISCIIVMPLAPSFGWLLVAYMAFCFFNDLGTPVESLKMEIVPPQQRAVGAAVMQWVAQVAVIIFWWVAIGRFEEVSDFMGVVLTGEQALFWSVSMAMSVMLLFLCLGVKETDPKSTLKGSFAPMSFIRGLFSSHLWPIYILSLSTVFTGVGLGALDALLVTQQWGYTKQDLGNNIFIGGMLNLILIPILGLIASRSGRFRVYLTLIIAGIVLNIARYLYFSFVLYDGRPTIPEMIVFGELFSIIGILTSIALTPLVYDFIPRNQLGTYAAGSSLVNKVAGLFLGNLVALLVWLHASLLLGPPGESVRVSLAEDRPAAAVEEVLRTAAWTDPATGKSLSDPDLHVSPVYATGARLDHGRGMEIRLGSTSSDRLRDERDAAESGRKAEMARYRYFSGLGAEGAERAAAASAAATAHAAVIVRADAELARRSLDLRAQVEAVLAADLIVDGAQVLAAATAPASVVAVPLTGLPSRQEVEMALDGLRRGGALPGLVDLRLIERDTGWSLEVSARPAQPAEAVVAALRSVAAPDLLARVATAAPTVRVAEAVVLDLRILEDPLDNHPSPISRAIDATLGWLIGNLDPAQRLRAAGRGVRRAGWIEHASVLTVPGDGRAIRVVAVVDEPPAGTAGVPEPPREAVLARFTHLNSSATAAARLYAVARIAGSEQRMTVAEPVLGQGIAKQQYDYLDGYLAIFVLQAVGVVIILIFLRMVRTGQVRRRGVEEMEAVS